MTVTLAIASNAFIVVTVDSAVTLDFGETLEYSTGRKSYFFPGVGCVTTWGARDNNKVGEFLQNREIGPESHTVSDLAELVFEYLTDVYRPKDLGYEDVGYHISGFDRALSPHLHHVFWGFDRPRPKEQTEPKYEHYNHSPRPGEIAFLYNGRNDLAEAPIRALLAEVNSGKPTRFQLGRPDDLVRFADFVARFAAEVTPEVGPPFLTHLIGANNMALKVRNLATKPLDPTKLAEVITGAGRWETRAPSSPDPPPAAA